MKRVLIYMPVSQLKPTGGPAGYLYNLYTQFKIDNITNIDFIKSTSSKKEQYRNLYNRLPEFLKVLYRIKLKSNKYKSLILGECKMDIDFNCYDYIHFHSTHDLYRARHKLEDFNGKIILTSHTPKAPYLEVIEDDYTKLERFLYEKKRINNLENADEYAFDNADYIIFPCEDAEEPYYNTWKKYENIKNRNKHKYRYLLSGTAERKPKLSKDKLLERFGIPDDAFIISYVGRHNEVKGYDKLKQIGEILLKEKNNIYFLIAGVEEPIKGLKHDRWIEVGWTDDPHSIISASDVFILANKETYFDLVMLEVLSLGKIVLASNTGGNKYFGKINAPGVLLYDNIYQAIDLINSIKKLSDKEKFELENKNKLLFRSKFNNDVFSKNYIKLISQLY